jgi:UPF0271 protein
MRGQDREGAASVGRIDLNADMGESFGAWTMGDDAAMLELVTTANVACGYHAGDPAVMHRTVTRAKAEGVAVGAHPGFHDLFGFGRRPIQGESPDDVELQLIYQISALRGIAAAAGHPITHVKAHGALANQAAVDDALAAALARAVTKVDPELILMVMPGMATERAAEAAGLRAAREIYADRAYADDFNLLSRKLPGAVLHDPAAAAERVLAVLETGTITSVGGRRLEVSVDTVCVHGDNPAAVAMAAHLRRELEAAGWTILPFARP